MQEDRAYTVLGCEEEWEKWGFFIYFKNKEKQNNQKITGDPSDFFYYIQIPRVKSILILKSHLLRDSNIYLYTNVHSGIIRNSQKVEITHVHEQINGFLICDIYIYIKQDIIYS